MSDPIGDAFLVNSTTTADQREPAIAALSDGGFVVVWDDESETGGDTDGKAIRAQIFGPDGAPEGGEFLANTATFADQETPSVTGLDNGEFVIAWADRSTFLSPPQDSVEDVRAQRFDASGNKIGDEFLVNTTRTAAQDSPDLAPLADGGFVAAWTDGSPGAGDDVGRVRVQTFSPTGDKEGQEIVANTTSGSIQTDPRVAQLADGGFVVLWEDDSRTGDDTLGTAVRGQVFTPTGTPEGGEFLVNTTTDNEQDNQAVAGLTDGRFVASWDDPGNFPNDDQGVIGARLFNGDGSPAGDGFRLNENTLLSQNDSVLTSLPGGGFVGAWQDSGMNDVSGVEFSEIVVQEFDGSGNRSSSEAIVNTTLAGDQRDPQLATLEDGGYAVAWEGDSATGADTEATAIRARVFDRPDDVPAPDDDPKNGGDDGGDDGGTAPEAAKGRVFLNDGAGFTLADPAEVFGRDGNEQIFLASDVAGVTTDANVDRLDIARSFADVGFQVTDDGLEIVSNGTPVVTIPSANQPIKLRFSDGDVTLSQTGAQSFTVEGESGSVTVDTSGADTAAITPGGAVAARPADSGDASAANVFLNPNASFTVAQAAKVFGSASGSERVVVADGAKGVRTDANVEGLDLAESLSSVDFQVTDSGLEFRVNGEAVASLPSINDTVDLRLAGGNLSLKQVGAQRFDLVGGNGDTVTIDSDGGDPIDIDLGGETATDISLPGIDTSTLDDGLG